MNFKKISILLVLMGIMIISTFSVFARIGASCSSTSSCAAGEGCCQVSNCGDYYNAAGQPGPLANTCMIPEKIKCPSITQTGDLYCLGQVNFKAGNIYKCVAADATSKYIHCTMLVNTAKFADGIACSTSTQCSSGNCNSLKVCGVEAAAIPPTDSPAPGAKPTVAARTGVFHYGSEVKNAEDILVNGGFLGKMLGTLTNSIANIKLGSAVKMTKSTKFGTVGSIISKTETEISNDAASSNYVKDGYVQQSIFARKSEISTYSKIAQRSIFSGGACTFMGIREIGVENKYGSYSCTGDYDGMDLVMVQAADDMWVTPKGSAEQAIHSRKDAGFGLVFCCNAKVAQAPKITDYTFGISEWGGIGFKTMSDTPVDKCVGSFSFGSNNIVTTKQLVLENPSTRSYCDKENIQPWEKCYSLDVISIVSEAAGKKMACKGGTLLITCSYQNKAAFPIITVLSEDVKTGTGGKIVLNNC